jgi:hypothetical protein
MTPLHQEDMKDLSNILSFQFDLHNQDTPQQIRALVNFEGVLNAEVLQ